MNDIEIQDLREHFFKVSNHIYDQELDVYEIGVYSCLCRFANNDNTESFPSITKIQEMLNISRPKVINCIKSLVSKKIIFKKPGHTGKSNRYYLLNLPSKRHLLVNDINQTSKPHLLEVVNEVNSKKTYIKKTNKKNLQDDKSSKSPLITYLVDRIWQYLKKNNRIPVIASHKEKMVFAARSTIKALIEKDNPVWVLASFAWAVEQDFWKNKATFSSLETIGNQFMDAKDKDSYLSEYEKELKDKFGKEFIDGFSIKAS